MERLLTRGALLSPSYVIESAWLEHAPFATWLIERLRPRTFVELGTHTGYSYFAICQAVRDFGTGTTCHAIDTFAGDEHAGFYGEEVYQRVVGENSHYIDFSSIHRALFSDAVHLFADESIDLLHIDGRHFYDDVKEDYEIWLPKLTKSAIVLFHDTNVRERDFGVWKLFRELSANHPHFEFVHNNGLGVLAPHGTPPALESFFAMPHEEGILFRQTMETLGKRFTLQFRHDHVWAALEGSRSETVRKSGQLDEATARLQELEPRVLTSETELHTRNLQLHDLSSHLIEANAQVARLQQENDGLKRQNVDLGDRNKELSGRNAELQGRVVSTLAERDDAAQRRQAIETSTSWRLTLPLRAALQHMPVPVKRSARGVARACYWVVTPHRTSARLQALKEHGAVPVLTGEAILQNGAKPHDRRVYDLWIKQRDTLTDSDRHGIKRVIDSFADRPLISIVMPVYDTPEPVLREAIASVQAQLYDRWELCIADDASPLPHVGQVLTELAAKDKRIRWMRREANGHIAAASNSALELATGEFVALMDHDDRLAEHALYEIVASLQDHPEADILYSDEDKVDEKGERYDPYFKPDFSYDQMLGQNLINHLGVYRRSLLEAAGGFRSGFEGSQDHDLALRCIELTKIENIVHVPEVLYHWRQQSDATSFSQTELDRCVAASRKALAEHLAKRSDTGVKGPKIEANPLVPSWSRVRWPLADDLPLVSVIIPTRDRADLLKQCVDGLLERTDYGNLEIVIVDNESVEPATSALFESWKAVDTIRVLPAKGEFNYSRLNNEAVQSARGDVVLLLNNDVDVIEGGWLRELVSLAMRPDVGCVGAKLLYADRRMQHAGVRLGAGRFDNGPGVAGHLGLFQRPEDPGYFGSYALTRDVGCVTAACLAVRREIYEAVGGLDEVNLAVAFNDVDFCLRIREAGYRILWTPFAELFHLESASRGSDLSPEKQARFHREARYMRERWGRQLDADPFYNRHFNNFSSDYELTMDIGRRRSWHGLNESRA